MIPHHRGRRSGRPAVALLGTAVLAAMPLLAGACARSRSEKPALSAIVRGDSATRTVRLLLVGNATPRDGGFNFDGYGDGAMHVTVPLGWRIDVTCKNASTVLSHSCAVIDRRRLAPTAAPIAFAGASTPNPKEGIAPGATVKFSFVAARAGTYRIACLVSGHEIDGMWDWFRVRKGATPGVRIS